MSEIKELTENQFNWLVERFADASLEDMDMKTMYQVAHEGVMESWGDYGYGNEDGLLETVKEIYPHLLEDLPND